MDPEITGFLKDKRTDKSKKDLAKEIKERIAWSEEFTKERFDDTFGDLDSMDKDTLESIK